MAKRRLVLCLAGIFLCLSAARAAGPAPELSMGQNSLDLVTRFIQGARFYLDVEIYHLTDKRALAALVDAARRGVRLRLILDPGQSRNWQSARALMAAGAQARWMLTDASHGQLMHAKAACADLRRVLVGSANWTYSGLSVNQEVGLSVDDPSVALDFTKAFEKDWQAAGTAWPRRPLRDEEMMSLPDPGQYSDEKPRFKGRKSALRP